MATDTAVIRKNATEDIHVRHVHHKGHDLIDVRVFYTRTDGELLPTKKGLTLSPETWDQLLPLIEQALEDAAE